MKKIFAIIVLGMISILASCIPFSRPPEDYTMDITLTMSLNNTQRGVDFTVNLDKNFEVDDVNNFRYYIRYMINPTGEDLEAKLDTENAGVFEISTLERDVNTVTLPNLELDYANDYVSAYVVVMFDKLAVPYVFTLESVQSVTLYQLAKVSIGSFAQEIIALVETGVEIPNLDLSIEVELNNTERGFELTSQFGPEDQMALMDGFEFGFIYVVNNASSLTIDHEDILKHQIEVPGNGIELSTYSYVFTDTLDYLNDRVYARVFVRVTILEDVYVYYSDTINFTMYQLALISEGSFADEIIEAVESENPDETIMHLVDVVVNTSNYTVTSASEHVTVTVTTDYLKVRVEIVLDSSMTFSEDLIFRFNSRNIASSNYTITGNILVYQFDDPNWSSTY
jgi:hypothetical protein